MHPRFKTEYFRQHSWPQDWINTAVDIAREIWQSKYKPREDGEQQRASFMIANQKVCVACNTTGSIFTHS